MNESCVVTHAIIYSRWQDISKVQWSFAVAAIHLTHSNKLFRCKLSKGLSTHSRSMCATKYESTCLMKNEIILRKNTNTQYVSTQKMLTYFTIHSHLLHSIKWKFSVVFRFEAHRLKYIDVDVNDDWRVTVAVNAKCRRWIRNNENPSQKFMVSKIRIRLVAASCSSFSFVCRQWTYTDWLLDICNINCNFIIQISFRVARNLTAVALYLLFTTGELMHKLKSESSPHLLNFVERSNAVKVHSENAIITTNTRPAARQILYMHG